MSKKLKRILLTVLAGVLVLSAGYLVLAESSNPTVRYNGATGQFEVDAQPYKPGWQPDLFTGLKDMMPGDSKVQKIDITVKNLTADRVYIYAEATIPTDAELGLDNAYDELLAKDLADTDPNDLIDFYIWNPTVPEYLLNLRNATGDKVLIGAFTGNGTKTIDVGLAIDIWASSNDLADKIAVVDWKFTAVEENDPTPPPGGGGDTPHVPSLETDKHINYIIGYDDGLVHPEGNLTRAQTAAIFYRLLTDAALVEMWSTEPCFSDVPETSWYFMYVATLTNGGILTGYPDGTFLPNQAITRAEFATIVARFDDRLGQIETTATFPDIEGRWFQEYIEFAATCGYVHGYPDGTFRPDEYITRAEAATLINHCLERHVDAAGLEGFENITNWPDNADPERWFYYEIVEAANYHDSKRSNRTDEGLVFQTEIWTKLYEPIDWEKIEQEWIKHLTGNEDFITKS